MDQGQVFLFDLALGKCLAKTQTGPFVQGHHQQPRGILVQAMDYPWTLSL
jgi:hypothetical protein